MVRNLFLARCHKELAFYYYVYETNGMVRNGLMVMVRPIFRKTVPPKKGKSGFLPCVQCGFSVFR